MTSEAQTAIDWVRELYKNTGVNMADFARLCGVSSFAVRSWIKAIQCPTKKSLYKVGEAFGITPPPHVLMSAEKYFAEALQRSLQASKKTKYYPEERKSQKKAFPYHWEYESKSICRRRSCEWKNRNGVCNLPSCMKEVLNANTRKSEKD